MLVVAVFRQLHRPPPHDGVLVENRVDGFFALGRH
jgi:hypothetical protein